LSAKYFKFGSITNTSFSCNELVMLFYTVFFERKKEEWGNIGYKKGVSSN
jgi:hypothetical protein